MATILSQDSNKHVSDTPSQKILVGSEGNTWLWSSDGWDLTRQKDPGNLSTTGVHIDCELVNIKVDPMQTALIIVDIQNIGLSKELNAPSAPPMYDAQNAILQHAIPAAGKLGFQIIWLNWGLIEEDLKIMPPSEVRVITFKVNTHKVDYGLGDR
jgi:hypothetical protein